MAVFRPVRGFEPDDFRQPQQQSRATRDRNQIQARLRQGDRLVLFPEGTSSDGNGILPFKSALLSVAELDSRRRRDARGTSAALPRSAGIDHLYAAQRIADGAHQTAALCLVWRYGSDAAFVDALAAGPLDVTIEFHPAVTAEQLGDRKALARYCEHVVRKGVVKALSGRQSAPWIAFGGAREASREPAATPQNA